MREFKKGDKVFVDDFRFPVTVVHVDTWNCTIQVDDKEGIGWSGNRHNGLLPGKRYWHISIRFISGRASKLQTRIKE